MTRDPAPLLTQKYDLRVPRYTSYPTAPHFGPQIGAADYRAWLAALPAGRSASLYIHIPFCDEMCWFCGCYTKVVRRYEPIRAYLDVLHREIDLVADALAAPLAVRHVHWGGGSPTMLAPPDWHALLALLRRRFQLTLDAELAVELDPRDATEAYVAALGQAGVNRASIGVQDFDADVQAAINRIQPFEVVARVIDWLRAYGIVGINLDLMYGLPRQTEARVLAMIDRALSLAPSRIALFGYAHVPWMRSHQRLIDERELPDATERYRQLQAGSARLLAAGYRPVGLDHFARTDDGLVTALAEGRLRRNFQGYTSDDAAVLIGLGASAIGSLPQGYAQNTSPIAEYRRTVAQGELPIARGIALSEEDRLRRTVIERLMCTLAVDVAAACGEHGRAADHLDAELGRLAPLQADGLVAIDGRRLAVTDTGRPFVRIAASAFDAYLQAGGKRYSRAV